MKKLIFTTLLLFSSSVLAAGDWNVFCEPWTANQKTFSLDMEVDETGGSYIDAWVTLRVFDGDNQIQELKNSFSYGAFWIERLYGKRIVIFELRPAGRSIPYKYDFLSIVADHPTPTGNSYLTYKGIQYQAECYLK